LSRTVQAGCNAEKSRAVVRIAKAECQTCHGIYPKTEMRRITRTKAQLGSIRFYGHNRKSVGVNVKRSNYWQCNECSRKSRKEVLVMVGICTAIIALALLSHEISSLLGSHGP